jgi:hypothetical protein
MKGRTNPRQLLRIKFGICPDCGDGESAPGGLRCAKCRDEQNERHRMVYAMQRAKGTPRRSPEKFKEIADQVRVKRKARVNNGQCIQCAAPSTRYRRCTRCRIADAESKRRYRERQKRKSELKAAA